MSTNHSDVSTALRFIAGVEKRRGDLVALYAEQNRPGVKYSDDLGRKVADAHQTIGYGMKMADLHTQVSIAKSLERLAAAAEQIAVPLGKGVVL